MAELSCLLLRASQISNNLSYPSIMMGTTGLLPALTLTPSPSWTTSFNKNYALKKEESEHWQCVVVRAFIFILWTSLISHCFSGSDSADRETCLSEFIWHEAFSLELLEVGALCRGEIHVMTIRHAMPHLAPQQRYLISFYFCHYTLCKRPQILSTHLPTSPPTPSEFTLYLSHFTMSSNLSRVCRGPLWEPIRHFRPCDYFDLDISLLSPLYPVAFSLVPCPALWQKVFAHDGRGLLNFWESCNNLSRPRFSFDSTETQPHQTAGFCGTIRTPTNQDFPLCDNAPENHPE